MTPSTLTLAAASLLRVVQGHRRKRDDQVSRLTKVIETGTDGGKSGRVAYVLMPKSFLSRRTEFEWREDVSFNAADAILADGRLKEAFRAAVRNGYAIVDV
jgi:hypothetical protein